jgi:hypothetical protein
MRRMKGTLTSLLQPRSFGLLTQMYAIVSVPLDCDSVNAVAVVCTRTVARADVSFAVHTGAAL